MNWGHKITLVILAFLGGMAFMVSLAMKQTNEMIDQHYYAKELAYQDIIDAQNRLRAITSDSLLALHEASLVFSLPKEACGQAVTGKIEWLKPDRQALDRVTPLALNADCRQQFLLTEFSKGLYLARISWESDGLTYYTQQKILIP